MSYKLFSIPVRPNTCFGVAEISPQFQGGHTKSQLLGAARKARALTEALGQGVQPLEWFPCLYLIHILGCYVQSSQYWKVTKELRRSVWKWPSLTNSCPNWLRPPTGLTCKRIHLNTSIFKFTGSFKFQVFLHPNKSRFSLCKTIKDRMVLIQKATLSCQWGCTLWLVLWIDFTTNDIRRAFCGEAASILYTHECDVGGSNIFCFHVCALPKIPASPPPRLKTRTVLTKGDTILALIFGCSIWLR